MYISDPVNGMVYAAKWWQHHCFFCTSSPTRRTRRVEVSAAAEELMMPEARSEKMKTLLIATALTVAAVAPRALTAPTARRCCSPGSRRRLLRPAGACSDPADAAARVLHRGGDLTW